MSQYSKKKRLACLLLCAVPFTGLLGGHRLYLGRIKSGFLYILLVFLAFGSESNDSSFSNFIGYTILAFWLVDLTRIIFFGLKDDQDSLVPPYINTPKFLKFIASKPSFEKFKSWWQKQLEEGEKLQAAEKAKERRQKQLELSEKKSERDKAAKEKYDEVYSAVLLEKIQVKTRQAWQHLKQQKK